MAPTRVPSERRLLSMSDRLVRRYWLILTSVAFMRSNSAVPKARLNDSIRSTKVDARPFHVVA